MNKQKNLKKKTFSMFLDHVDSFGNFFLGFLSINIFTLVKKGGQNNVFAPFSTKQFLLNVPC